MNALRVSAAALALLCAGAAAQARIVRPLGRTPRLQQHLEAPRLWVDEEATFALERPTGERWRFATGVRGPDGEALPLFAQSPETGAQLIIQSAASVQSVRALAQVLADKLGGEQGVHIGDVEKLGARGGEAWGFGFTVASEARGRVAVVRAGDRVALLIASWPVAAPASVADDVAGMIETLGPARDAL